MADGNINVSCDKSFKLRDESADADGDFRCKI